MYSNIIREELPADSPVVQDIDLIVEQADRCRKIVGGLLHFARKNQVNLTESDIVKLARHSIDSVIIPDNIRLRLNDKVSDPKDSLKEAIQEYIDEAKKNNYSLDSVEINNPHFFVPEVSGRCTVDNLIHK